MSAADPKISIEVEELLQRLEYGNSSGPELTNTNIVFVSDGSKNILSDTELEQRLKDAYNLPRSLADYETLIAWKNHPDVVQSHFKPKKNGTLVEESERYADHTLSKTDWETSQVLRKEAGRGKHLNFNIQTLTSRRIKAEKVANKPKKWRGAWKPAHGFIDDQRQWNKWDWKLEWKQFHPNHKGGNPHDITKMSAQEQERHSLRQHIFDHEDSSDDDHYPR
ncbi:hypothetical protein BP6252_01543 [Coleophoma cylindrospora]|uniref:Uncharacterized protein n=1 Tax=Coleophoma cylindrospora TaxID=1849047 RepID=A0A3D8STL3_9HELO|nr:hypothetical protein BP6252_01543 [Coleophoma cylindrospora]